MQNKAARYVTKRDRFTSTKVLLMQCGWLSVNQMVFFHTLVLFFKTRQSKVPMALFNMASAEYPYNTREKARGNYKVLSTTGVPSALAFQSFRWRSVEYGLSRMYVLAFWSISDQTLGLYSHRHFEKH